MGLFDWLFGKKKQNEDYSAHVSKPSPRRWQKGDRVLAPWLDGFCYPGHVRLTKGNLCEVAYDDGDAAWVHEATVSLPDIRIGSQVFCRAQGGPAYWPGKVSRQNGEKIEVQYDGGEKEWTTLSMVRVQRPLPPGTPPPQPSQPMNPGFAQGMAPPEQFGGFGGPTTATLTAVGPMMSTPPPNEIPDVGDPVPDSPWTNGDRVLGRWYDLFWYPATILAVGTKGVHLLFDDGDQRIVGDQGLMPLHIEEGEEVFIRVKNQPQRIYTPGRVTRVQGEIIDVDLEDGTQEANHKVSRARFWRCPVGVRSVSFDEGDRVWATDIDGFTYPAEVLSMEEDKIIVQFLDGPERMLTPELVRPFELKPGTAVACRWKAGQNYFPGKVTEIQGDRVHIAYDDGDKEWNTVRLLRLPANANPTPGPEFRPS